MSYWKTGNIIQNGKYVIEKLLGAGGAGVTYRAKDVVADTTVAIKTLNAMIQAQPDFHKHQERFVQEAFRLAKCNHPHVIQVDDVCKEGDLWCMVMEYITGGDLELLVKQRGGLSEAEAIDYISQVGSALTYIHQQGILHRDVKPANIMVRKETDEAVLIDFGLARDFIADKTQIHTNSRTEGFAPIEQYLRSAKRGAYTDVYALAGTLYYLLTVQIPFPAQFRNQGINLIHPQEHRREISDRTNYAILKGMELEPQNRPQSVAEWLDLLLGDTEFASSQATVVAPIQPQTGAATEPANHQKTSSPPHNLPVPPLPPLPLPVLKKRQMRKKIPYPAAAQKTGYDPLSPSRFTKNQIPSPQRERHAPFTAGSESQPEIHSQGRKPPETSEVQGHQQARQPLEELKSAVGIDYSPLKELLAVSQWQQADLQTSQLMLKAVGKEDSGWIDRHTMKNFPCEDLHTLDRLWVKYSKGRFGFSVQKRIYQSLGGKREYDRKTWEALGDRIGWRTNGSWLFQDDLNYTLAAPQGHLPSAAISGLLERGIYTLISRGMDCNLS